jgi:DNA-binding MarR family transcriptional regulator
MLQRDDDIVREDGRITTRQQALIISISKESVSRVIRDIEYSKMCVRWVSEPHRRKQNRENNNFF